MYDELVKALRICEVGEHCDLCPKWDDKQNGGMNVCQTAICKEAADAIEELICEVATEHNERLDAEERQRWIPVTERLPEKTGTYLAWMKWDLTEADEEPSAYPVLYDADVEGFGWWKSYFDGETLGWAGEDFVRYEGITHWMPLPEPTKEE